MSEPASPAVVILSPSAEDRKWAADVARHSALTLRGKHAHAYIAEKLIEAIEDKKLWRVNHLLTTAFLFRGGLGRVKIGAQTGLYDIYRKAIYGLWNDYPLQKDYPRLVAHQDETPMQVVTAAGYVDGVKLMLGLGENPALIAGHAIAAGQLSVLEELERASPGVAARQVVGKKGYYEEYKRDALSHAIYHGVKPEVFDWLLARREKDSLGTALLEEAIERPHAHAALKLIAAGVSTADSAKGYSPLQEAARMGLADVVSAILDKGENAKYADSIGGTLLLHATAHSRAQDDGAQAAVVDVLLQRLPVPATEISEAMKHVSSGSVVYKRLKAALAQQGGDVQPWRMMGPQQVGTVTLDRENGVQLTEVFNLATEEHLILSRNLETRADTLLLRENFAAMTGKAGLEAAKAFHAQRTAKPKAPQAA